ASPRPIGEPAPPADFDGAPAGQGGWSPQVVTNSGEPLHPNAAAVPPPVQRQAPAVSPPANLPSRPAAPSLSEAFVALLAAEQGQPLVSGPSLPALALSEATIDEIASRVIARLGAAPMRQAVLDAAGRLGREENDRS